MTSAALVGPVGSGDQPFGITLLNIWTDRASGASMQILEVSEHTPEEQSRRLLIETPAGRRLVLDALISPIQGRARLVVVDDESGWRAELQDDSELKLKTPYAFADSPAWSAAWSREAQPLSRVFEAANVPRFEMSSTTWDDLFGHRYFAQLDSEGKAEALVRAMPEPVREAIWFLALLRRGDDGAGALSQFAHLLDLLEAALAAHDRQPVASATAPWQLVSQTRHKGTAAEGLREVEFASRFRRVSASNLLSGLRSDSLPKN